MKKPPLKLIEKTVVTLRVRLSTTIQLKLTNLSCHQNLKLKCI